MPWGVTAGHSGDLVEWKHGGYLRKGDFINERN